MILSSDEESSSKNSSSDLELSQPEHSPPEEVREGCWWCLNACGSDEFQKGANSLMRHGMEYMGTQQMYNEMAKYRWAVFDQQRGSPPVGYAAEFQTHFEHLRSDEVLRYRAKCMLWDELEHSRGNMYTEDENLGMVSGEPAKGAAGSFYNAASNLRQICRATGTGGAFNA
jgi:hypothetical protein